MADVMEFVRGDGANHTFSIEADKWSPAGRLFFVAKPGFDDDLNDSAATIQGTWTDANVLDETIDGVAYKTYDCYFPPDATNLLVSDGASFTDYLGEFQWVPSNNDPITFPGTGDKLIVRVYFDLKRKTSV